MSEAYDARQRKLQDQAYADQHGHDVAWMSADERAAYEARLAELAAR
jgi:hypothetical protein